MKDIFRELRVIAAANGYAELASNYDLSILKSFVETRIEQSDTPYPFHWRKSRMFSESLRMKNLLKPGALDNLPLDKAQLHCLTNVVAERTFTLGLSREDFLDLSRHPLSARQCLYVYRNKVTGKGYVGITSGPCITRDRQHKRDKLLFDRNYQVDSSQWDLIVLAIAQNDNDYDVRIATVCEPLLILLLNTYSNRETSMGYNVDPGASKSYKKHLL